MHSKPRAALCLYESLFFSWFQESPRQLVWECAKQFGAMATEATFALVWVEPLECSVLGGGAGEIGSTTAQTFAISGISGPKNKRVKFDTTSSSTQMYSMLIHDFHQLHDRCVRFCGEVSSTLQRANDWKFETVVLGFVCNRNIL